MKLIYIYPNISSSGGVPQMLLRRAAYLIQLLHEVIIITDTEYESAKAFFYIAPEITMVYLDFKSQNYKKNLANILLKEKADVTTCIAIDKNNFDYLTRINDGSKKVAEYRTSFNYIYGFSSIRYAPIRWYREKLIFLKFIVTARKYNQFVTLSEGDNRLFKKFIHRTIAIPNFLKLRAKAPAVLNSKSAIAIGRLTPVKNFGNLIKVWAEIIKFEPEWTLHIFGEGPEEQKLESLIISNGLQSNIFLRGVTQDIVNEISLHSIMLMTSHYEGFGNVLLEAAAMGLPIVFFDCGAGPKTIVQDEKTGYIIPKGQDSVFIEKTLELMQNVALRKTFGYNGWKHAEKFTSQIILKKWTAFYEKLTNDNI